MSHGYHEDTGESIYLWARIHDLLTHLLTYSLTDLLTYLLTYLLLEVNPDLDAPPAEQRSHNAHAHMGQRDYP